MEVVISMNIIDSYIIHDKFIAMNNALKDMVIWMKLSQFKNLKNSSKTSVIVIVLFEG